jgi:glutathione S-transferase
MLEQEQSMITVHHLGVSQSERIVWLCEELGLPYELKCYERDPVTRLAPAAYKALHPVGTAPIISDGDMVMPESGAIIDYILGKYGNGRLKVPPESANFADYVFWFHFANGSVMPNMMMNLVIGMVGSGGDNPVVQSLQARNTTAFALIEKRLGEAPYFAGKDFTAADIIMLFPLTTMRSFASINLTDFPNLHAYLHRIGDRPAYQRAMAKGDPGMPLMLD